MPAKIYGFSFSNDPTSPTVVKTSHTEDGVTYDVLIVPRKRVYRRDGALNEQIISQGPRSATCPYCGK